MGWWQRNHFGFRYPESGSPHLLCDGSLGSQGLVELRLRVGLIGEPVEFRFTDVEELRVLRNILSQVVDAHDKKQVKEDS